ncbi:MAG: deoxyribodipyrimidine photo-lyase/cryptochrome family protein, partial [Pseudomonadota bacterium]
YIYEPDLIHAPDFSRRHLIFVNESLAALDRSLRKLGSRLLLREGDAVEVISKLREQKSFDRIRVHQETTNGVSFERDKQVLEWARSHDIEVVEYRQQGVMRRLKTRDVWAKQWQSFVVSPLVTTPRSVEDASTGLDSETILPPEHFGLPDDGLLEHQPGGEIEGSQVLASFLGKRAGGYIGGLSSPVTAWEACSRLSPYLAYGNLSLRTVYQRTSMRKKERQRQRGVSDFQAKALTMFTERLAWHCHFMQKLEDEPRIEFENMNRAFDGLRDESEVNHELLSAWTSGRTGYPMIDACMRALIATGWINFRMRAMLISFATQHLWLHWREPALHLARMFLDYEPGIHYSQIQMQAGTTGIAAKRIYSPIKQVLDHDPEGVFLRRWLPELANVPNEYIAEPHKMPTEVQKAADCMIGQDYPPPIVDHLTAYREARQRLQAASYAAKVQGESARVFKKHGSRRKQSMGRGRPGNNRRQRSLF